MTQFTVNHFAQPVWFWLLALIALLIAGYVWLVLRRRRQALKFSNLDVLAQVSRRRQGWAKHVPAALLAVVAVLLTVALAGPVAEQKVPRNRATVMLTIDVSLSMMARDVAPSRLEAAKVAAKEFSDKLTPGINLGLTTFSGTATVLVTPTTDRASIKNAIDGLRLSEATATGDGIKASLMAIDTFGKMVSGPEGPPPARIVLMADGGQTVPSAYDTDSPRSANKRAEEAKRAGVPISTISFGTSHGTIEIEGEEQEVEVDDEAMQDIAERSGGQFHKAASAEQLRQVYDTLGEQIGYEIKETDASRPWLFLGTLLLLTAAGVSLLVGQRLP